MVGYDALAKLVIDTTHFELGQIKSELGRPICAIGDAPAQDIVDAAAEVLTSYARFVETPGAADGYLGQLNNTVEVYEAA